VLGGGLTGLATGWELAKQGVAATVLEAGLQPGGACRTLSRDGFSFDFTGHLLHLAQAESRVRLTSLGLDSAFRVHRRRAAVAVAGTFTPYPIQIHTHRLPPLIRRDCLLGAIEAHAAGEATARAATNFADWVLARFGAGLARAFFFPYNRKLFGTEPADLTTEWVGRYVPRPDIREVVDGALGLHRALVGYNATFLYPRSGGIRILADALAARCPSLQLGARVTGISLATHEVELADTRVLPWDRLVATAALSEIVSLIRDLPPHLAESATRLRAAAVVNYNFGVRGPAPRRDHWIYVPEPEFPFYRVGIPSNHGHLAPPGCHTLSVEVSVPAGALTAEGLLADCMGGLERLGLLHDRGAIATVAEARIDPAYVIFDRARTALVAALREHLAASGVRLAGRWAQWKYSAMEDALHDGAAAAAWAAAP